MTSSSPAQIPPFVWSWCHLRCHLLTKAGFIISPKSSSCPSTEITWLGKTLTSAPGRLALTNTPQRVASTLLHIAYLRAQLPSRKALLRLLGTLQWLAAPGSELSPWLAP
eukprot:RCo011111